MTMGASAALRIIDVLVSESSPESRMNALQGRGSARLLEDPWRSQLENMRITPQLAERAARIRSEIENRNIAKDAVSIARGSIDRIASPENVVAGNDTFSGETDTSDMSTNVSSNEDNEEALETNIEQESTINPSDSNNYSSKVLGLQTLLPIAGAGVLIFVGIIWLLYARKNTNKG